MTVTLTYWTAGESIINLGDFVTHFLLEQLGFDVSIYGPDCPPGIPIFLGAGTMLSNDWLCRRTNGRRKLVWGSGWRGEHIDSAALSECKIYAVRGPITRDHLRLPADLPLGDPALLLPFFIPKPQTNERQVSYVPHISHERKTNRDTITGYARSLGASDVISTSVTAKTFVDHVSRIAQSNFVITSSLHGAIVAQAYGVPWAPHLMPGEDLNVPVKWLDWFAYLGLGPQRISSDPYLWWEQYGMAGRMRDLAPLIRGFPLASRRNFAIDRVKTSLTPPLDHHPTESVDTRVSPLRD